METLQLLALLLMLLPIDLLYRKKLELDEIIEPLQRYNNQLYKIIDKCIEILTNHFDINRTLDELGSEIYPTLIESIRDKLQYVG